MAYFTDEDVNFDVLTPATDEQIFDDVSKTTFYGDADALDMLDALEDIGRAVQGPVFLSCSIPAE